MLESGHTSKGANAGLLERSWVSLLSNIPWGKQDLEVQTLHSRIGCVISVSLEVSLCLWLWVEMYRTHLVAILRKVPHFEILALVPASPTHLLSTDFIYVKWG